MAAGKGAVAVGGDVDGGVRFGGFQQSSTACRACTTRRDELPVVRAGQAAVQASGSITGAIRSGLS